MHRNGEIGLEDRRDRNKEKKHPENAGQLHIRDCVIGGQMLALHRHGHHGGTLEIEQVTSRSRWFDDAGELEYPPL